jgi:glucosamine 6-phosphate synthetase-like amidotransferase/phosphosugar isomerase protein
VLQCSLAVRVEAPPGQGRRSITPETPTVVLIPHDDLFRKNLSTIEEIRARRGPVIAITHPGEPPVVVDAAFEVPASEPELDPLLLNIPLQLLAYHVALKKGCDIDQPRASQRQICSCSPLRSTRLRQLNAWLWKTV